MLNIIFHNNLISGLKKYNSVPSFGQKNQKDVFVKSTGTSKRGISKMPESNYDSNNVSCEIKENFEEYSKKIKCLPRIMDGLMAIIGQYVSGKIDADEFADVLLSRSAALFRRIEYSENGDEYVENYKPEVDMIRKVTVLCNAYKNKEKGKQQLDESIAGFVSDYVKTPFERKKLFTE